MKAAFWTAPRTFAIREVETPAPRGDEALIRVGSAGVCGSDAHLYRDGRIGDIAIREPHILGHEFGGVVEAVASPEYEHLVGRRVAVEPARPCMRCAVCLAGNQNCCPKVLFCGLPPTLGGYREYMTWPGWLCEPVPDSMSHAQIAALEPLAIGVHIMDLAKPGLGRTAAILGAGMIGQMILETLKRFAPHRLIVIDRLDCRLEMSKSAGATHTVNFERDDPVAAVRELTGGLGADYVFEATTDDQAPAQAVAMAGFASKVFLAGINEADRILFSCSEARRRGLTIYYIRRSRRTLERAIRLLESGAVDVDRTITHTFPLERLGEAFETVCDYKDGVLKAMIEIGQ
ncbi:MAG: Sorbitol dehydrogenase [candidate division BRC1 bacterium ADurb.BinA364]|nr:MAG: Sorbitol dehydrogenase [candidate division BRC1 bacterium ADurb.BinA364]